MKNPKDKKIEEETEEIKDRKISELEAQIQSAEKAAEENLAGWQRAKADFVNYKKDQEKMFSDFRRYANEDMIIALLPTVDSFALATKHLPEELKDSDWAKGVICIKGMFENFLKETGVSEIKTLGEKFDPNIFEAVGEEESESESGTVIEEVQRGYKMGDKVIRAAKVKVAK
ncbi:MAG: nucleotide exchange factor GrpE [Patescibacteria group bacterium]